MQPVPTPQQLRSFGTTVGGIFALIALWPAVLHGRDPRWWIFAVAVFFIIPALTYPGSLLPVHRAWMAFGHIMGWVNTRIILGLVFYLVVTPIGLLRSWMGKDPMGKTLQPELETYRVRRQARPTDHMKRQY